MIYRVSILVILEVDIKPVDRATSANCCVVSILVILEVDIKQISDKYELEKITSFNPCYSGS